MFLRGMYPLIEAGPGGYYVSLDGKLIRKKRKKLEFSIGRLVEMSGVSKRTLYGYEKGLAKASVSNAYNLEWVLGVTLVQPINVFKRKPRELSLFAFAKRAIIKNRFLQTVLRKFTQFGFVIAPIRRAPFDFIAMFPEEEVNVMCGVVDGKDHNVDERTKEIISVSEVTGAKPVFITDGEQIPNSDIPLIYQEELARISCPEAFIIRL